MGVNRPFRRTCRQFADGEYLEGGRWQYLLHKKFAKDPQHYVRAFLLLQQDLLELFAYVEPADQNLEVYSHRIQQLLMRSCVEIEANLTAVLKENGYKKPSGDLTMQDYRLIEHSHRLSAYEVRLPGWNGQKSTRQPFAAWSGAGPLTWYQAYNKSKHDRHEFFHLSTLNNLIESMAGLSVLLSAQFMMEDYSPRAKSLGIGRGYSYDTDDGMDSAIGGHFRVKWPSDWPLADRYDFDWQKLAQLPDPFDEFDHSAYA